MATPSPAVNGSSAQPTWQELLRVLKAKINPHSYSTWFAPTREVTNENGKLTVQVPSPVFRKRLQETYAVVLQGALASIGKPELQIEFFVEEIPVAPANGNGHVAAVKPPKAPAIEAPAMPAAAWYGFSKEYLAIMGPRTEASANYHLGAFLAAVGSCLGRRVYLEKAGKQHANLFVVLVGRSGGGRKGTAVDFGIHLARSLDPRQGFVNGLDSREGFLEHLGEIGDKQKNSSTSAIVHLSELRSLIEKTHMEGLGGIVPLLCEAYDAPPELAIHTRKNPIRVEKPVVSLLAATTTMWMEGLTDKDLHGGLGNRICWIYGQPGAPIAHPPGLDEKRWKKFIDKLGRALKHWPADKSVPFSFSPPAADRWTSIYSKLYTRALADDPLISVLSERMQNHCLKAALIWAALDQTSVIELHHLEAGFAFTEFLYDNLWTLFRGFGVSPMAKLDQQIVDAVKEAGGEGIRQRQLKKRFWRTDAELFNKRLYYLSMNDGPIVKVPDGQRILLFSADEDENVNGDTPNLQ